eukprot:3597933-Pyramimonas_sp.AAC.5
MARKVKAPTDDGEEGGRKGVRWLPVILLLVRCPPLATICLLYWFRAISGNLEESVAIRLSSRSPG